MKRISLPTVGLKRIIEEHIDGEIQRRVTDVQPVEVLLDAAYDRGERGLTIAEQRRRLPLWEKLEATKNNALFLEDAEWALLKELMDKHEFGWVHKDMIVLGDAIVNAETVPIEDVAGNREQRRATKKRERAT